MRCDDCGIDRWKLHVHHIQPKSQGGSNEPTNLVRICANCHENRHGGDRTDSLPWQLAHSPEAKAKRAASMKKLWADPAYREQQRLSRVATHSRPEVRRAHSEGGRRYFQEHPEEHEKLAARLRDLGRDVVTNAMRGAAMRQVRARDSEETKQRRAAAIRAVYADPERAAEIAAAKHTPEANAKRAAAVRAYHARRRAEKAAT